MRPTHLIVLFPLLSMAAHLAAQQGRLDALVYGESRDGLGCGLRVDGSTATLRELSFTIGLKPTDGHLVSVALPQAHLRRAGLPLLFRVELREDDGDPVSLPEWSLALSEDTREGHRTAQLTWELPDRVLLYRERRLETALHQHHGWDGYVLPPGDYQLRVVYLGLPEATSPPAATREADLDRLCVRGPVASGWCSFRIVEPGPGQPPYSAPAVGEAYQGLQTSLQLGPWPGRYHKDEIVALRCTVENVGETPKELTVETGHPFLLQVKALEPLLTSPDPLEESQRELLRMGSFGIGEVKILWTLQPAQRLMLPLELLPLGGARVPAHLTPFPPSQTVLGPGRFVLSAVVAGARSAPIEIELVARDP
jgi:hypothetical protein